MERQQVEYLRQQQAELEAQQKQAKKRPYSGRRHSEPAKDVEYVMDDDEGSEDPELQGDMDLYQDQYAQDNQDWGRQAQNHQGHGMHAESSQKKEKNIDLNVAEPFVGYEDDELEVEEFEGEEFDLYNNQNLKNIQHIDQFVGQGHTGGQNQKEAAHLVTKESDKYKSDHDNYSPEHLNGEQYADDDLPSNEGDMDNEEDLMNNYADGEDEMDLDEAEVMYLQQNMGQDGEGRETGVLMDGNFGGDGATGERDSSQKQVNDSQEQDTVIKKDGSENGMVGQEMNSEEEIEKGRMDGEDDGHMIYKDDGEGAEEGEEDGEEIGEDMINFLNEIPVLEGESEEEMIEFQQKIFDVIVKYQLFNDEEFASLFQATVMKNERLDEEFLKELFEEIAQELQHQLQQTYGGEEGYEGEEFGMEGEGYEGEEEEEEEEA